jgi:polysaccharide biosynthesis protein PslH
MNRVKELIFQLLGKEPEAVVVTFLTGEAALAAAMFDEVRRIIPGRRHYAVSLGPCPLPDVEAVCLKPGSAWSLYRQLRARFGRFRIGMAPVLLSPAVEFQPLRRAAFLLAPRKILAYNTRMERRHLRLRAFIASLLFLRGVPVDRIFLRPSWLVPWKKDRTSEAGTWQTLEGRPSTEGRPRVAVLSPYFPYPLSHGGAVRIFNLLREAAREFDIVLFAFTEGEGPLESAPVLEFCSLVVLAPKPRYREPRWSTLRPPEVNEYRSKTMQTLWEGMCRELGITLRQVEYTQLASYGGEILVEHDITFDLYRQIRARRPSLACWWDWWRWRSFEVRALARARRAVVMSDKDAEMVRLAAGRKANPVVIGNGVDLGRFRPVLERPGERLLFIGSFRHFPNVVAYRFFVEQVWPLLRDRFPEMILTAVAGPEPELYCDMRQDDPRIRLLGFVRDVVPLYIETNLVIVPTLVSAGTNLKVLEAMAMERAVVSTPSGCAGLGLEHGKSVWVAGDAAGFAEGIATLIDSHSRRRSMALEARRIADERFDWSRLGELQRTLWRELADSPVRIRPAEERDIAALDRIQRSAPEAVLWDPHTYLSYDCRVAEAGGAVAGFLVCRTVSDDEHEVLSLVVAPEQRRRGIAAALMRSALSPLGGSWFLEVRESNAAARNLYRKLGFQDVALRMNYYQDTGETAVVMKRSSC